MAGKPTLLGMVRTLEGVEFDGRKDLNEFMEAFREWSEAGRKVCNYLTTQTYIAEGEVQAELKKLTKGAHVWRSTRAVCRKMRGASDHLADASADFIAAYAAMNELMIAVENAQLERAAAGKP